MSSKGCEGGNNVEERRRALLKKTDELIEEIRETRASEENKVMIRLMVGDSRQRDVGRGIARIDQKTMQELGISAGDVIEIVGKRTTSAIAWPAYSEDQNREITRIDGFTRKNAGVAINKYVVVRAAKVKNALSVTLTLEHLLPRSLPVDMRVNVEDFTNFVRNRLMERTFVEGDTTLVFMQGHTIPFNIENTDPDGIVRVTSETKFQLLNEPVKSLIFRAYKRDDKRGYLIQGLVFSNDKENYSIGFILERINYPSGPSLTFTLGTEANNLGRELFDLFNRIFKKFGKFEEVKKGRMWVSRLAGSSFDVSLLASWHVEENKWKDLTQEIEKTLGIS